MRYSASNHLALESDYKYTARDGSCRASSYSGKVGMVGSENNVKAGSSSSLMAAIAKGPVSVTVEADRSVFQRYTGGVLNSAQRGTQLDHAITAVGYNADAYIVRNSWGSSWGDRGYIQIAMQSSGKGICGIQQVSVYPTTN